MKKKEVLFVLNEAGAASYIEPLLLQESLPWNWRLRLSPVAKEYLQKGPLAQLLSDHTESDADERPFDVLISSASPSALECTALSRAKKMGAKSAIIIDAPYNYARRWEGLSPKPDSIFVVDEDACHDAQLDGLPTDNLKVMGHPHFESLSAFTPQPKSHVLFVDQPIEQNYGMTLGYTESSVWQVVLEARKLRPDLFEKLYFAAHPANKNRAIEDFKNVECLTFRENALEKAGTVIGMFSSVLLDAWYAGRTVISLQPDLKKEDFCILSRSKKIPKLSTALDLIHYLENTSEITSLRTNPFAGSCKRIAEWIG